MVRGSVLSQPKVVAGRCDRDHIHVHVIVPRQFQRSTSHIFSVVPLMSFVETVVPREYDLADPSLYFKVYRHIQYTEDSLRRELVFRAEALRQQMYETFLFKRLPFKHKQ
jgi:hypothetical protein